MTQDSDRSRAVPLPHCSCCNTGCLCPSSESGEQHQAYGHATVDRRCPYHWTMEAPSVLLFAANAISIYYRKLEKYLDFHAEEKLWEKECIIDEFLFHPTAGKIRLTHPHRIGHKPMTFESLDWYVLSLMLIDIEVYKKVLHICQILEERAEISVQEETPVQEESTYNIKYAIRANINFDWTVNPTECCVTTKHMI